MRGARITTEHADTSPILFASKILYERQDISLSCLSYFQVIILLSIKTSWG
jgi:hypothetical protein